MAVRQGSWSLVGGLLLGAGWWCVVDGLGVGSSFLKDPASVAAASYAWLPLLGAMVAFLMINCMMWGELQDNPRQPTVAGKARVFLLLALFVLMASVAGAAFIMVDKFLSQTGAYNWAGSESSRARERTRARAHERAHARARARTRTRERAHARAHERAHVRAQARRTACAQARRTACALSCPPVLSAATLTRPAPVLSSSRSLVPSRHAAHRACDLRHALRNDPGRTKRDMSVAHSSLLRALPLTAVAASLPAALLQPEQPLVAPARSR